MTIDGVPVVLNAGDMTHLLLDVLVVILILLCKHLLTRLNATEELVEKLEQDVFRMQIKQ